METVIAKLQAIHLDHHAIQSKQQQKIDRLRRQVQQQKQIIPSCGTSGKRTRETENIDAS